MPHQHSPQALLSLVRKLVPPLLSSFHKGQSGRVAVVGGCEDYTGAPFFSAMACTLLGADMSHIICERVASTAIKSYSPNIMVHPYLYDSVSQKQYASYGTPTDQDSVLEKVLSIIDRVHVVVIGPGLGRDKVMIQTVERIIQEVKKRNMPIVIDADGLFIIQKNPDIIKGYTKAVLTPNVVEFQRLKEAVGFTEPTENEDSHASSLQKLSQLYGGLTILEKGQDDYISNDKLTLCNPLPGGLKRVSGQGDTLSGSLATFLAWKLAFQNEGLWDHGPLTFPGEKEPLDDSTLFLLAAFGASAITRYASYSAFQEHGRALLTSHISDFVGKAYTDLIQGGELPKEYLNKASSSSL